MSKQPKDTNNSSTKGTQPANIAGSVTATEKVVPLFNAKNLATAQANFEDYSAPVPTGKGAIGDAIQGARRVDPGAALAEKTAQKEWVEGSGIPEHLYKLNCFVGADHNFIAQKTKWGVKSEPVPGKKITKKELGLGHLDLSKGYWYAMRFDWQKNTLDTKHAQFKPLADSFDLKGKQAKYLSTCGTGNAAYTLRVTEAEIESAVERWGVVFPYWVELEADPEKVSQLYWQWVLESGADVPVAVTEGIKKAMCLIGQGIPCIALPGVNNIHSAKDITGISKSLDELHALRMPEKKVFLVFDSDLTENAQVKTALRNLANKLMQPADITNDVGADVRICGWTSPKGIDDYFVKHGIEALEKVFADAKDMSAWEEDLRGLDWYPQTLYTQIEDRFKKYFIAIGDSDKSKIYLYDENTGVYSFCPTAAKIVTDCLNRVSAPSNDDEKAESETTAGKPAYVREMLACIRQSRIVAPEVINPPRQWCTPDGVLTVTITGDRYTGFELSRDIRPHAPYTGEEGQAVFTCATHWSYDPGADERHLERFFEFIPSEEYKETLLDFLSVSLDMPTFRGIIDAERLPCLFLKGPGSNGKNALKNLLELIYPGRTSSVDLRTIKGHDTCDKKWQLQPMEGMSVNFSSENEPINLGNMSTFKSLVTADPIVVARKNQPVYETRFDALQIHCTNKDLYSSEGGWSFLRRVQQMTLPFEFKSQEKIDQAPARDRKWLKVGDPAMSDRKWQAANIAPAFFNVLCDRAISVLNKGTIDWSCCEHERSGLVDKSDHVRGFLESEYVVVTPDGAEGFIGSVALYELYKKYCESIDRAEITLSAEFLDADPRSKESKADPLCMTSAAFSRRLLSITKNSFRGISKTSKWCSRTSKAVKGFAGLEAPASKK